MNVSDPTRTSPRTITVRGTTLEQPLNVRFMPGVEKTSYFLFYVVIEAAP